MTFFMENLDATVIATALPAMAHQFHVPVIDVNIGISAYLLAVAIFIPLGGWLADRFGARTIFVSAIVLFTFASILCGLSTNLNMFVIARILQGLGGAMMVPVGRLVVIRSTPKKELVQAIAYITWPGLVAPILGAPLGGFIVTHFSWEWIFFLNIPLGILGVLASFRLIQNLKSDDIGRFDTIGFLLLASGCACFMYGLEKIEYLQKSVILIVLGIGLFVCAVRYMQRQEKPLLKFDAFKQPTFYASIVGGSIFRMTMSAVPFLLPLLFQMVFQLSAWHAGLLVLIVFIGNLAMKPFTTRLMRFLGFKKVLLVNGIVGALSIASGAMFTPQTPWWVMGLLMFISGLSRSLQYTCYNSMSFAEIQPQDKRYAATQFSLFFQMSFGVGIAVSAVLLRGVMAIHEHRVATLYDFQWVFLTIAIISLFSLVDTLRLPKGAGDTVSGYQG